MNNLFHAVGCPQGQWTGAPRCAERRKMNRGNLKNFGQLMREEDGMGTVEVILIIVVLVGLVILFKEQITKIVNNIFKKITTQTEKV